MSSVIEPNVAPLPARETAIGLLREMLRIRRFEEECIPHYQAGKIRGFLHLYVGEEAVAAGIIPQLRNDDAIVGTYREHGQALVRGVSARAIMAEMFGKVEGCARGRGGSMHLFDARTRFYGGNAIVGGGLPLAAGLALADKLQHRDRVTVCFFGEGAAAEGAFHETMNLAALWQLPVLFVCENNRYAMGTPLAIELAGAGVCAKAIVHGVSASEVDGMDVAAVWQAARSALEVVRQGKPYLLECKTYRFRAHSMFDAELYRTREEVHQWEQRDPISGFRKRLLEEGMLDSSAWEAMEREVSAEINDAVAFANAGASEPVEQLTRFVYAEESTESGEAAATTNVLGGRRS